MTFAIEIKRKAQKSLAAVPSPFRQKLIQAIRDLAINPYPPGHKKLSGRKAWKIRLGSYRVIYEVNDKDLIILVLALGHRKDVYRGS